MRHLPKVLLMTVLAAPLIASDLGAVVRKCSSTMNGLSVRLGQEAYFVVDGVVLGQAERVPIVQTEPVPPGSIQLTAQIVPPGGFELDEEDTLSAEIVCLEVELDGEMVGVQAIAVFTRKGSVEAMRTYLTDLVEAQESFRTATGEYAQNVAVLRFFASRPPLPIDIDVTDDGWMASVRLDGQDTACQVSRGAGVTCG